MKSLPLLMLLLLLPSAIAAQDQRSGTSADSANADVLAVIDRFMVAISSNDIAALQALRLPGAMNTIERPAPGGGTLISRRVFDAASFKPGPYRERYWDAVVHVRGSLAIVWTPYEFWVDGKTTHCGVDVFELVRQDGAWKIGNVLWTVEPDACPALRPSDPARVRPAG